ncbi:MAG: Stp1/IreP family PP2C-type Ser/Thr phosphatase [Armatimonadota bacterium]
MPRESQEEITAELPAPPLPQEHAKPKKKPTVLARTKFAAKTDLGLVRENNEDKFDFIEPEDPALLASRGSVYAVADGMGGHAAGQIAAELALKTFFKTYYESPAANPKDALTSAVAAANTVVHTTAEAVPGRSGMGCTLTAAVVLEDQLLVVHVGDSRAYLVRSGELKQLTEDHSWVAEQVKRGAMTQEEARLSPFRNVITRSIGASNSIQPDVFSIPLQSGDLVLLCTDGLSGVVSDSEILKILSEETAPSFAAAKLIDAANSAGGPDNITVLILRIDSLEKQDDKKR